MEYIYCDESGESSFSEKSAFKHFLICALVINDGKIKKLINTIRRKETYLYNQGWPKNIEIKASFLHNMIHKRELPERLKSAVDGNQYIENIMMSVIKTCNPRIEYFVVNKTGVTSESLKNAPYGIAYNFFAGKILVPLLVCLKDTYLIVDQSNKELHHHKHFNGYIHTKVIEIAEERGVKDINLRISHEASNKNEGLRAVDMFAWSIFRKHEFNDDRFYSKIESHIVNNERWYCT